MSADWTPVSEAIPQLGKRVLVCRRGDPDGVCIQRLQESEYIVSGEPWGVKHKCFVWHNGYSGFEFEDSYWRDVPEPPPLNDEDKRRMAEYREHLERGFQQWGEMIAAAQLMQLNWYTNDH